MTLLAVLLLAAAARAAVDFSKLSSITTTATFHLHVEIDQLYFGKKTNASVPNSVAMIFSNFAVELPIKDNINDFEASATNRTRPYFFHSSSCLRTQWTNTGETTLPTPHVVINEDDTTIYQYVDYADQIMYSDFERPYFVFGVQAFEQSSASPPTRADCNFVPPYDARNSSDVISAQLCYTQNSSCNVWIGDFGWVYFGGGNSSTNATFGVHLEPTWYWTGTRRLLQVNGTKYIDVRAVDSLSDSYPPTLTLTQSVPFEFEDCEIASGGILRYHMDPKTGNLARYMSCNSVDWNTNATVVIDFENSFDRDLNAPRSTQDRIFNFTLTLMRVKYAQSYNVDIDSARQPRLELFRMPDRDFVLREYQFSTVFNSDSPDLINVWFTIGDPLVTTAATTTTTAPTTTGTTRLMKTPAPTGVTPVITAPGASTTTAPVTTTVTTTATDSSTVRNPVCAMACNGHGTCVVGDVCDCAAPWTRDAVLGCQSPENVVTMPPTLTTLPRVTVVTEKVSFTTEPPGTMPTEPPRTINNLIGSTGARGDDTEDDTDDTGAIIGGVIGGLVCLALIIGLVCFARKRSQSHRYGGDTVSYNASGQSMNEGSQTAGYAGAAGSSSSYAKY